MEPVAITEATAADLPELADVARQTFPLACPPSVRPEDVAAFIDDNLSADRFRAHLQNPDRTVLVARRDERISGYTTLIRGVPDNEDDVQRAVSLRPAVEVSKLYVLPDDHGTGVAAALITAALRHADELGAKSVWLGVNQLNERAQRFYAKHGFTISGTRTFHLGAGVENDYVMTRPV